MLDRAAGLTDEVKESHQDTITKTNEIKTRRVTKKGDNVVSIAPVTDRKIISDNAAIYQVLSDVIQNRLHVPLSRKDHATLTTDSESFLMRAPYMHDVFAYLYPCMRHHKSVDPMGDLACLGMTCTYYMAVNDKHVLPSLSMGPNTGGKTIITIYKPKVSEATISDFAHFFEKAPRSDVVVAMCGIQVTPRNDPGQRSSGHVHVMIVHRQLGMALLIDPNGSKGAKYFIGGPEFLQKVVDALGDDVTHPVIIPAQFGPQQAERLVRKRVFGEELLDLDDGGWCGLISHAIVWLLFKNADAWTSSTGIKDCMDAIHRILVAEFFSVTKMYAFIIDELLPVVRANLMDIERTPRRDLVNTIRFGASFGIDMNDELLYYPTATKRVFDRFHTTTTNTATVNK